MPEYQDQTGAMLTIRRTPQRIVSLVPSQTELLFDLGLREEVVGITKFCIHPSEWFRTKVRVGGTKNINIQTIKRLEPDLIIANKEENTKEQIAELRKDYPVWISDINTLEDAYDMIESLADITGTGSSGLSLIYRIQSSFANLKRTQEVDKQAPSTAAYLIWCNPYMAVGANTFIHHLLGLCGFENVFAHLPRYPVVELEQIQVTGAQCLLLSSEPYPFRENHCNEFRLMMPDAKVFIVDGEMFSWYGSRLVYSAEYFVRIQQQISGM